ncbi:MAG: redox-sensing transcriptional repressor Rex [Bacteroidota bacterium]|jgi:redox-sensing transcriptional repressor|nr:redox-sensing transcriptional repressor Rex [Ignavibacteria bacterium]MCU7497814.1 redox-sensing transcriptional repressor Rex [Ignavibacteria bacterium]MCU7511095.1 redox-sensing transcriptional repressor Rex [Ignavibacteria bacterium]MCU7518642.1 redox-sensing transcriptional repressor Rex [Ignavibacteria bacterium]MCU7522955.1 redox-sensing transcriptional repressor Rex [Ignavibacteria bacterium]
MDSFPENAERPDTIIRMPTVRRLPRYLRLLNQLKSEGREFVSSDRIAQELDLKPIVVRKDLGFTGICGKPRIGYSVEHLIISIENVITFKGKDIAFLAGVGNLGSALLGYNGFGKYGLNIAAAFDPDKEKVNKTVHDKNIYPLEMLPELASRLHPHIGILCVPEESAQEVTDIMVSCGIKGIWNFSSKELKVPSDVVLQNEDLAAGLAVLSISIDRKSKAPVK